MRHKLEFEKILERPEIKTWRSILQTQKVIFSVLESNLQTIGFTLPRFQIMFHLYFEGAMSPSALADRLTVSRGNITAFLRRLLNDNVVQKTAGRSESRPKYILTLRGMHDFEKIFPQHVEKVSQLVTPMSEEALKQLDAVKKNAKRFR
ncbi:MAG: MarR family transcriptional regulator [Bdellovibrionota bacterium]